MGNVTEAKPENLVDCDTLGIQREELYCRNITIYQSGEHSPVTSVQRTCVAMSWYVHVNPIIIGFLQSRDTPCYLGLPRNQLLYNSIIGRSCLEDALQNTVLFLLE